MHATERMVNTNSRIKAITEQLFNPKQQAEAAGTRRSRLDEGSLFTVRSACRTEADTEPTSVAASADPSIVATLMDEDGGPQGTGVDDELTPIEDVSVDSPQGYTFCTREPTELIVNGIAVQSNMSLGISNLPNQKHRHALKKGCHLTMMTVGPSGAGKTTFVNTLFTTALCSHKSYNTRFNKDETTKLKITEADLEERNFHLRLTLIDTPGFGERVNNSSSWLPIVSYLDEQFNHYLNQEMRADRTDIEDTRVHVALYFIQPNGQGLSLLDIFTMKELALRTNLIPVISKADTLTPEELTILKGKINEQIATHEIEVYRPPTDLDADDEDADASSDSLFAIVSSEDFVTVNGEQVRGREYSWGVVEVENDKHSDFKKLRSLLLRSHLLDLITRAENTHYERYRDNKLSAGGLSAGMTPEKLQKDVENQNKKQEEAIRKKFSDQVKEEENRFKQLQENQASQSARLNTELENLRKEVENLRTNVNALQVQAQSKKK